jgi:hypothetical protein
LKKTDIRNEIFKHFGQHSKTTRMIIKKLRTEAQTVKKDHEMTYRQKIEHLKRKYREDEEMKMDKIPDELKEFGSVCVFDRGKFENLEIEKYDVKVIGDILLDDDEKRVLTMHPKFAVMSCLEETEMKFEMEMSYAKYRYELSKEIGERLNDEDDVEITEEKEEKIEELEARARQFYDPEEKTYDYRNKWVTDLQENTRVSLPKALEPLEEASIEMRRAIHLRIFREYMGEECDEKGKQSPNLLEEEDRGLKKLLKRIQNHELVVLKTDKSTKFVVATV